MERALCTGTDAYTLTVVLKQGDRQGVVLYAFDARGDDSGELTVAGV